MKKKVLFLLSLCMMLMMAACGNQTVNEYDIEPSGIIPSEDPAQEEDEPQEEEIEQNEATGVSLLVPAMEEKYTSEDFTVTIAGGSEPVERTLPFPVQDLIDAGWTLEGAEENLCYGTYTWENRLTCGDSELRVQIENSSDHDRPVSECVVVMLNADTEHPDTVTVAGFAVGDPISKLTEMYGDPTLVTQRDTGTTYVYTTDIYKRLDVSFDEDTGNCVVFDLQWMDAF